MMFVDFVAIYYNLIKLVEYHLLIPNKFLSLAKVRCSGKNMSSIVVM